MTKKERMLIADIMAQVEPVETAGLARASWYSIVHMFRIKFGFNDQFINDCYYESYKKRVRV